MRLHVLDGEDNSGTGFALMLQNKPLFALLQFWTRKHCLEIVHDSESHDFDFGESDEAQAQTGETHPGLRPE